MNILYLWEEFGRYILVGVFGGLSVYFLNLSLTILCLGRNEWNRIRHMDEDRFSYYIAMYETKMFKYTLLIIVMVLGVYLRYNS